MPDDESTDPSLWETLGISREQGLDAPSDDVWDSMLAVAVDPSTPPADESLVPVFDDPDDIDLDAGADLDVDLDDDSDEPATGHHDTQSDHGGFDEHHVDTTALGDHGSVPGDPAGHDDTVIVDDTHTAGHHGDGDAPLDW